MDLIVTPTYNEAESIETLLMSLSDQLVDPPVHVLVVDDSSPDGTADVVRGHAAYGECVFLLSRPVKDGLGGAYRDGFAWAHERGYRRVVQMDADGSHPVAKVRALLTVLDDVDVAVGSRYVAGGEISDWSWSRRVVSRLGNLYARAMLDLPVLDSTSGFRAYRSADLAVRVSGESETQGYGFQIESTWRVARAGLSLREVPIRFVDRKAGRSKMTAGIAAEAAWRVARWRWTPPPTSPTGPAAPRRSSSTAGRS